MRRPQRRDRPKAALRPLIPIRLEGWAGMSDGGDVTKTPAGYLDLAENLRFDRGVPRLRAGIAKAARHIGVGTSTGLGMAVFKTPPVGHVADDQAEQSHRVVYTWQTVTRDSATFREGRLWVDVDGSGTYVDKTPEGSGAYSLLTKGYGDTFFAQLFRRLYGVNGKDGLFYWDGGTATSSVLTKLSDPVAPGLSTDDAAQSVFNNATADWTRGPGLLEATVALLPWKDWTGSLSSAAVPNDPDLHARNALANEGVQITVSAPSTALNKWIYLNIPSDQRLNLTVARHESDDLLIVVHSTRTGWRPGRLYAARNPEGLAGLDPSNSAWDPEKTDPDRANWHAWDINLVNTGEWQVIRLPLSGVPDAVLADIQYLAFRFVHRTSTPVASALGSIPAYTLHLSSVWAPGRLPDGVQRYRLRVANGDVTSPAGPYAETTTYAWPKGPVDPFPDGPPVQRVQVSVPEALFETGVTHVEVFRAVPPVVSSPGLETDDYRLVDTIRKGLVGGTTVYTSDQDPSGTALTVSGGQILSYDSVSEVSLELADRMGLPRVPPGTGADAPYYITATESRLVTGRSDRNESRVWLGDVGVPGSLPDVPFAELTEPGSGGYVDIGLGDGDVLTGLAVRVDEILAFKRRSVFVLLIRGEGTEEETLLVRRMGGPGCIATRSICAVDGGIVYAAEDGLYRIAQDADVPERLPFSGPVQRTWDAIPAAMKDAVWCAYHPVERLLLVGICETGSVNTAILAFDLRTQSWSK